MRKKIYLVYPYGKIAMMHSERMNYSLIKNQDAVFCFWKLIR